MWLEGPIQGPSAPSGMRETYGDWGAFRLELGLRATFQGPTEVWPLTKEKDPRKEKAPRERRLPW